MQRFAAVTVLCLLVAAGCGSTASGKGAAAGKTATQAAGEIDLGLTQFDATLQSLDALVNQPAPDLTVQYEAFTKQLGKLESTAHGVAALATKLDAGSDAYFERWDEQLAAMRNEDIRKRSIERRTEVENAFKKLREEYAEVRGEFKPLLDNLRDVRTALGSDLTMNGLKAIKGTVDDAKDEANRVKESLQELAANFRKLGAELAQSGPPAPAEPAAAEPAAK